MGKSVVPWILLMAGFAAAQPAFDVASVKPSPPPEGDLININLGGASHGVVTLANTTLSECIRYAYGLANEDQIAGPDWIRDRHIRFDITAKAPPATPPDELLAMMQTLLAQRFRPGIASRTPADCAFRTDGGEERAEASRRAGRRAERAALLR